MSMTRNGHSEAYALLQELAARGVAVFLRGGRLAVRIPWRNRDAVPPDAIQFLRELKKKRDAVVAVIRTPEWVEEPLGTVNVRGRAVPFYPTRAACMEAGRCLWPHFRGCSRFPIATDGRLSGFCRAAISRRV